MIASGDIKLDEAAQLQKLYIIKLKRDIFMLETNLKNYQRGGDLTYTLKQKPKYMISENKLKITQKG